MSELIQMKQRIKSIKSTKKLTQAMRVISMSLYSRLDLQQESLKYHESSIQSFFNNLLPYLGKWENPIIFPTDILNETPLIIIISGSKGFCGSLNANLFRVTDQSLFIEEHQKPTFMTIGRKALDYVQDNFIAREQGTILDTYLEMNSNNFLSIATSITRHIQTRETPFSSVSSYSSYLKNFFVQIPRKTGIIPFVSLTKEDTSNKTEFENEPIWEQELPEIATELAFKCLSNSIAHVLFQALISENAARFLAMDGATNNAQLYLEKMTLQYNKLRQGLITKEVCELCSNL